MAGREKHRIKANSRRMFDLAEMKANLNLSTLKLHAEMQIIEKLYGYNLLSSRKLFSVSPGFGRYRSTCVHTSGSEARH